MHMLRWLIKKVNGNLLKYRFYYFIIILKDGEVKNLKLSYAKKGDDSDGQNKKWTIKI